MPLRLLSSAFCSGPDMFSCWGPTTEAMW